jgi:archaellin
VLTAAIASAVILKTAYSLKDQAEAIGQATTQEVSGGVKILDITGSRENSQGSGTQNTNIERVTFLATVWSGSQGIDVRTMRIHWLGPTRSVYLTVDTVTANGYLYGTSTNFGCDNVPSTVTNDWNPPNVMWLQWTNMVYIELEVGQGSGLGGSGIGETGVTNGASGIETSSHCSIYFEPAAGLVVEESFTTPTTYGTSTFIDLTMQ